MTHDENPNEAPAGAPADAATPHDAAAPGLPGAAAPEAERPPASRKRWILAAMAALGVALFAVPFIQAPDAPPGAAQNAKSAASGGAGTCPESEGRANFDFTLKDANGANVRLSDYKGKVVLLNFWATWCGPCKVEIPEFVDVYAHYRERGFEILGVLTQDEPSRDDLRAFTSSYKMTYPILHSSEDFENAHGPIWALPTTYIIDRNGSICSKHMGPVSREMVEQEIKGLL